MKKNLGYEVLASVRSVNPQELVAFTDQRVRLTRKRLIHVACEVEIWVKKKKKLVVLLTNNFEFTLEEVADIYRLRRAIESL